VRHRGAQILVHGDETFLVQRDTGLVNPQLIAVRDAPDAGQHGICLVGVFDAVGILGADHHAPCIVRIQPDHALVEPQHQPLGEFFGDPDGDRAVEGTQQRLAAGDDRNL